MTREHRLNILKTVPGLAVSAFFIWWTFIRKNAQGARPVNPQDFRAIHLAEPAWLVGVVAFSIAGYTIRSYRWWCMLRNVRAKFSDCARIFMTSLAANNILPLRLGDVMRIFTYAGDLHATPSVIMSTVLLEKLLDVFTLATMFVVAIRFGRGVDPHLRLMAEVGLAVSTVGLLIMVFGARTLQEPVKRLCAQTKNAKVAKLEHWVLLALESIRVIGIAGTLWLVVCSFVAWVMEGCLYVSAAHLLGLQTDWSGPWHAVAQANLSFLIPSSPGGIGPFEFACKDALMRHGVDAASASIFGLLIHAWLFAAITLVGGGWFLAHRLRAGSAKPLLEEIDTLPAALP